jgi:glycosyltransferase involved in cell wall biosynthesis
MARKAGIGPELLITGLVDRVQDYINALDLGVLASIGSETIARAALEIMACQVPLLSSDVGVMPDLLPPDALFPASDENALAGGLIKCMDDAAWRAHLRECGREAIKGLGPDDFLQRTLSVYENAMRK